MRPASTRLLLIFLAAVAEFGFQGTTSAAEPARGVYAVGVAKINVTPKYPIRLSGFGSRRAEADGVTQRIWAKALAIDDGDPAILITVDNLGIPTDLVEEVAGRLAKKVGVKRDRLTITATHTHTAPMLQNVCPTLFGMPIPQEHQQHINRYTAELADNLEKVALAALADRQPSRLSWGIGTVGFAINRRQPTSKGIALGTNPKGPVDHDLPVLVVRDLKGKLRAIYVSYACHCVTLSNNKISGDWAGYAQERIQDDFPAAVALVSVGCGGDSNPSSGVTGDKTEIAARQGAEIAAEVKRLLGNYLAPVAGKVTTRLRNIELPLADPPTRADWETRAKRKDAVGYHARVQLERLERGEPLRTKITYPVQTWTFGDSLALVFLPGEVVVDYSLRLKRELDGHRVWINAYSNDAPCYIPSERVLREGGYEARDAMVYYDLPGPFKPGLEEKIVRAVHEQIGQRFQGRFDPKRTGNSRPLSPQQSLAAIRTKKDLAVELVAAEPLVIDPVAIDWGPDGKLYVAEMIDYPTGKQGDFKPGGRIRVLEDTDGDGRYDKATVFLDNLPFPTGVRVWRKGVLICAAPDIIYAEDTDGDGKADVVRKLFTGFGTDNYQGRVNSLEYGLDRWVYGSCGLFGGKIRSLVTGKVLNLGDRDFRCNPDTGEMEPASGRTQQGRVRDDWGNWFGCDNTTLCRHYPLADHYLRRNPNVAPPDTAVLVADAANPNRLFPIQSQLQLFKLSGPPGHTTAACGLGIYRDDLLGKEYTGNAFVCEPVNLVVHRLALSPKGSTFSGRRAADEAESEFLASTDNWSRFVQARTGPDGCLWIVDMYRYVIEHPRWIPPEELAKADIRAGDTMGRIYRIRPKDRPIRTIPRLDKLDGVGLVVALDSPNGWQRDLAGQMLLWKYSRQPDAPGRDDVIRRLQDLAKSCQRPEGRLHALCVLGGLADLGSGALHAGLVDQHPGVRRHTIRLSEKFLLGLHDLDETLVNMINDPDAQVRLQLAYTLGEWRDQQSGRTLAALAGRHANDAYLLAAVLSSVHRKNLADYLNSILASKADQPPPDSLLQKSIGLAVAFGDDKTLPFILHDMTKRRAERYDRWQIAALAGMFDALERQGRSLEKLSDESIRQAIRQMTEQARVTATEVKASERDRLAALRILAREPETRGKDLEALAQLLRPQHAVAIQAAAANALARIPDERAAAVLIAGWTTHTPALKSQTLDLLLSREAWHALLLRAIEKKEIPAGQIDARRRQRLLTHRDEKVRSLAARLFEGAANPDRRKLVRDYQDVVSMAGDKARGKAVFAKRCAACHVLDGVGHSVGPDLAGLANKSPQFLLTEILDPNQNVDTRYIEYLATTKAGRTFTGILAAESATSITLRGQEGKDQVLLRSELEELQSTGKSLMAEGLEKDLSKQDLADVIAYLSASSTLPKKFPGNRPVTVRPVNGQLALLATNGEIYGNEIAFEEPFRNIGFWHGADDRVVWTVQLDTEARFDVWLDWACADAAAGNSYLMEGIRPLLHGKVAGTGGWDRYRQQKIGSVTLPAGYQRLTFRPDGVKPNGALLDLRGIYFVPEGKKPRLARAER